MVFDKITGKEEEGEGKKEMESDEGWVELAPDDFKEKTDVKVRVETLKDLADTRRIQEMLREDEIVFLKIKRLRQDDLTQLKRAVDKLKKTCLAMDGDIIGVDEDFLVLTPGYAKIWRGK